jgi:MFS family permease
MPDLPHETPVVSPSAAPEAPATAPPRCAPPRPDALTPRAVITAVYFAFAIGLGLWAGSIPALMRQTGLDVAGLGIGLTLQTSTYIAAMAAGGHLAHRVPPRRLVFGALLALPPCFAAIFLAPSVGVLLTALLAMGAAAGLLDLAMNVEGTSVERDLGRPVLLSMHASASGAFALGSLGGSLIATGAGPGWNAALVLAVVAPVAWAVHRLGPRAQPPSQAVAWPPSTVAGELHAAAGSSAGASASVTDPTSAAATHSNIKPSPPTARRSPGVAAIGIVLGLTIAAEVAAQMWSARFLERQAAELAAFAGAGAAFFAGFQAAIRLFGDALRRRVGDQRLILASLTGAALGFLLVAGSASFAQSLAGFALVGLGTACVVPCCFAIIGRRDPHRAAAALGTASLVAGAIRVPTPLLLGAVAAAWSDAVMFACVAGAMALAGLLARHSTREGVGA